MIKKNKKKGYVGLEVVILAGVVLAATGIAIPYIMNSFAEDGKEMAGLKNKIPDASVDNETGYIVSGGESIHLNGVTPVPEVPSTPIVRPEDGLIHVESITVTPNQFEMLLGETKQISWNITPVNADNQNVAFRLSNRDVVTVSSTGKVTAIGLGTVEVKVVSADTGVSSSVVITVNKVPPESIVVNHESLTMIENTSIKLEAQVLPANTTDKTIIFSSENPNIATVSPDGTVTAKTAVPGNNKTNILVICGDKQVIIPVTVIADRVYTTGIEVDNDYVKMFVGDSHKVTATTVPANASDQTFTYSIRDTSIATVDNKGNITALKKGTTVLEIKNYGVEFDSNKFVELFVYIEVVDKNVDVTNLSIGYDKNQMTVGDTQTAIVSIFPDNATNKKLTWTSNNTAAIKVDGNGKISAVGVGTATITATSVSNPSISSKFTVNVVAPAIPVTSLITDKTSVSIKVGESVNIETTVSPSNADNKNLIWTTSDDAVALADGNNKRIIGVSAGVTQVKIASEDNPDVFVIIQVVVQDTPIEKITIEPEKVVMDIYTTNQFAVHFDPVDASNKSIVWSVSDPNIGTISNSGLFTSKAYGTTKVIATAINGVTAEATVTVQEILPTRIMLDKGHYNVQQGSCIPYQVTMEPSNVTTNKHNVIVDNTVIAEVDTQQGTICGLLEGKTSMTVYAEKDNNVKASAFINVTPVLVEDLIFSPTEITLNADSHQTYTVPLMVHPLNAKVEGIKYLTTDPQVATVDIDTGLITAVDVGECEIHVIVEGEHALDEDELPGVFKVKVISEIVRPTDFIIDDENLEFILGKDDDYEIKYHFEPSNTTEKQITWESSDESVALVNPAGYVTPIGIGSAVITGKTSNGLVDSVNVRVRSVDITSFKVEPSNMLLSLTNPEGSYTIEILPAEAEQSYNVSIDEDYLYIDRTTQTLTAIKPGKTTVYFYDYEYNKSDSIEVEIMSEEWDGGSDGSDLEIKNGVCYVKTPQQLSYLSLQTQFRPLSYTCDSVRIMNSLDMKGGNFTPFGTVDVDINGGGYTINNLYIDNTGKENVAFIQELTGSLSDLSIKNANIHGDNVSIVANNFSGNIFDLKLENNKMYAKNVASTLFNNATKGIVSTVSLTGNKAYSSTSTSTVLASSKENVINTLGNASLDQIYIEQDNAGSMIGTTTSSNGSLNHVAFNNKVASAKIINTTGNKVIVKNSYFLNATDYNSMSNPENVHFGKDNANGTVYNSTIKYDANGNTTTSNAPAYTVHANYGMKNSQDFVDLINSKDTSLEEVWFKQTNKYPNFIVFANSLVDIHVTNTEVELVEGDKLEYQPSYTAIPSSFNGKVEYTCKANTNDSVATVNSKCEITAIKEGTSDFTVDFGGGFFETIHINVKKSIPATAFSIVEDSISERIGFNIQLTYELTPENSTSTIQWFSKDSLVALVDPNGKVFGVSVGETEVTGTVYGANGEVYKDTVKVTVLPASTSKAVLVSGPVFQEKIKNVKDDIKTIKFSPTLPQASYFDDYVIGTNAWDVSEAQDGSIMAYLDEDGDLTIAGTDGVTANADSSSLFKDLNNLTSIYFYGIFYTQNVTNMSSMFAGCTSLSKAEVDNWDVSKLQNADNMFASTGIVSLNLSKWDTQSLTSINKMFNGSDKLAVLDATGLNVSKVTAGNAANTFSGMSRLEEVSFGENWKWVDSTSRLDVPDVNYIPESIGKWYSQTGATYLPAEIPNGAGVYSALPTSYAIEYVLNGGTNPESASKFYLITTGLDSLPTPTRKGYTFNGWYGNSGLTGDRITKIERGSRGAITLYAKWTANTYELTFDANGGSLKNPGTNLNNGTNTNSVTLIFDKDTYSSMTNDIPTRVGYKFKGWYTAYNGGVQVYDETGKVTNDGTYWKNGKCAHDKNYTVYAGWEANTLTVVYHSGGATSIKYNGTTISENDLVSNHTQTFKYDKTNSSGLMNGNYDTELFMEKTGYDWEEKWAFGDANGNLTGSSIGQATSVTGQSLAEAAGTTLETGDKTIHVYGVWTPIQYTVVFNANGATSGGMSNQIFNYDEAHTLNKNKFERKHTVTYVYTNNTSLNTTEEVSHTFNGWATSASGAKVYDDQQLVKNLMTTSGTYNLYANWTPKNVALKTPASRTGYTFNGWYTAASGGTLVGNGGDSYTLKVNTTLYTHWTPIQYSISYNLNGGSVSGNPSIYTIESPNITLKNPTKVGYTFVGWTGSNSSTPQMTVTIPRGSTGNKTYVANYNVNKYTVVFNGNGATSGTMSNQTFSYGQTQSLHSNTYARKYTITYNYNYSGTTNEVKTVTSTFNGWAKTSTGSKVYNNSQSVSNLTSTNGATVNLYANWTLGKINLMTPVRSGGYTFAGWYTAASDGTLVGGAGESYTPTANITLYAHWIANDSKVATFNANGGTTPSPQTLTRRVGEALGTLPTTSRSGYSFTGWYTATSGGSKISSTTLMPSDNVTYYARWSANTYKVTLNNQNATTAGTTAYWYQFNTTKDVDGITAYYYSDESLTTPLKDGYYITTPAKTGYTFGGYYTGTNGSGTQYVNASGSCVNNLYKAVAGNTTLYAKWTAYSYTVKFDANGGSGTMSNQSFTYGTAQALTANTYSYTGKVFAGWNTKADGSGTSYADKQSVSNLTATNGGSVTLYAQWEAIGYTLKIDPNGGYRASDNSTAVISVNKQYGQTENISVRKRTGYTLSGYDMFNTNNSSTTDIGGATFTFDSSAKTGVFTQGTVDITLKAKWTANTYAVKFNGNGSTSGSMSNQSFTYGTAKALSANAFGRAYTVTYNYNGNGASNTTATATSTFKNWNTKADGSGTSYTDKQSVSNLTSTAGGTVNLYAQWTLGNVTLPTPTRAGYTFIGWYNAASGGVKVGDGGAAYAPTANMTLYAQWSVGGYTVKFNGNGNTGGSMSNQAFVYGTAQALTVNSFTKTGYTFKNWNTKADGSGTSYTDKQSVNNLTSTVNGVVNLYAQWTANTYYVKLNGNGSTSGSATTVTCTYDKACTLTSNPFGRAYTVTYNYNGSGASNTTGKATYEFKNWNTNTGGTGTNYANGASVTNLTSTAGGTVNLYAQWTSKSVTLPTPTRAGYTFNGWYNASSGGTKIGAGGATYTPTANITLYAQWSTKTYTVTLNGNGGTVSPASISVTYNGKYTGLPAELTRAGYTFVGWFDSSTAKNDSNKAYKSYPWLYYADTYSDLYTAFAYNETSLRNHWFNNGLNEGRRKSQYLAEDTVKITSNTTLYAGWSINSYTATFNANGGSTASPSTITKNYGSALGTLPTTSRTGYTFNGWYTAKTGGTKITTNTTMPANNVTYYAQWTASGQTATFDANGGSTPSPTTIVKPTGEQLGTLPTVTRAGYTFNGWYTAKTGGTKISTTTTMPAGGATYYAQWTPVIYKVTLNNQSATSAGTTAVWYIYNTTKTIDDTTVYFYSDANCTTPLPNGYTITAPTKTGYKFGGYFTETGGNGTQYIYSNGNFTNQLWKTVGPHTLYAKWTANTYTVTYNGNGSTSGSMTDSTATYNAAFRTKQNAFTKTGYTFNGWNEKADGSGTAWSLTSGGVYEAGKDWTWTYTKDITLYAQWKAKTFTVTYNGNGSTSGSMTNSTATYNAAFRTKQNAFTRTGYTFNGWNEKADGSGAAWSLTSSGVYEAGKDWTWTYTKDITLYAQWSANTIKITLDPNGGSGGTTTFYYKYGTSKFYSDSALTKQITSITPASRTGYTLGNYTGSGRHGSQDGYGYVRENGTYFSSLLATDIYENCTLYAQWSINSYTATFNANGGSTASPATITKTYGSQLGTLPTTSRTNYAFKGWYTATSGGSQISTTTTLTKNVTYYAQWRAYVNQWRCRNWGSWTGWSGTSATETDTLDVETRKVATGTRKFYHYEYYNSDKGYNMFTWHSEYGGTKSEVSSNVWKYNKEFTGSSGANYKCGEEDANGFFKSSSTCEQYTVWKNGTSQTDANKLSQYYYLYGINTTTQYRTRSLSDWSSWSTTECSTNAGSSNKQNRYGDYGS